ncbi:MAG: hypothetical protein H6866_08380 [Rhodospirillales bacterium]|nr:MAG: hypothetical protein H6866_08380 [Rhodospirillales bacterium]
MDDYYNALAKQESSNRPDVCAITKKGDHCCGLYQFCSAEAAQYGLQTAYQNGKWVMTSSVEAQQNAIRAYTEAHRRELQDIINQYVGKTDSYGTTITESGILGAAHLCGVTGVKNYLTKNMDVDDGNTSCSDYLSQFAGYSAEGGPECGGGGNGSAVSGKMCDQAIYAGVSDQVNGAVSRKNEFVATNHSPPPSVAQVTNTPCMSKELQRIGNQFSNVPSMYSNQFLGGLLSAGGPISGLMSKMFGAQMQSFTQAAQFLPKMLNFQSMAQSALSSLMDSLGLGDAFSSQLCGLMVDMILKYVQCENPIKLPSLGKLGSLNNLLPKGCAGDALRSTLYQAANMQSLRTASQPIVSLPNGTLSFGSATDINDSRGLPPTNTTSTTSIGGSQ